MYCPNCGATIEDSSKFCIKCGVALSDNLKNTTAKSEPKTRGCFKVIGLFLLIPIILGVLFEMRGKLNNSPSAAISAAQSNPFEQYLKAAEGGDANAQYNLGLCYKDGSGTAKDEVEAVKWYRKAAEQGLAKAQYFLGICYSLGKGVVKDQAEAVKWCRKAAEQDYADAQYFLGLCYRDGEGVEQDKTEAVKWLRNAAEQGNKDAQSALEKVK